MGIIKQGILGGFSGRVGTVVGGSWKSINYMRALATSISNPNTAKQKNQRTKFAMSINFLHSLVPYVRVGYRPYAINKSAYNAAMSYMLQNAFNGFDDELTIDYQRVMVSRGHLMMVGNAAVSLNGDVLTFTWTDNSGSGDAQATDVAMPLVYNKKRQLAVYSTNGATRRDASVQLTMPSEWSGEALAVYLGFRNEKGDSCADSICLRNDAYAAPLDDEGSDSGSETPPASDSTGENTGGDDQGGSGSGIG